MQTHININTMNDYIKTLKKWLTSNNIPYHIVYEKFDFGEGNISPQIKTERGIYLYATDDGDPDYDENKKIQHYQFVHNRLRCKGLLAFPKALVDKITTVLTIKDIEERFDIKL